MGPVTAQIRPGASSSAGQRSTVRFSKVLRQAESFIPAYIACGGGESDAVDVLLRNKILYKMDGLNPVICRAECGGIIKTLERIFGEGALPKSVSYLKKFER